MCFGYNCLQKRYGPICVVSLRSAIKTHRLICIDAIVATFPGRYLILNSRDLKPPDVELYLDFWGQEMYVLMYLDERNVTTFELLL